jgi:hypothetical protein
LATRFPIDGRGDGATRLDNELTKIRNQAWSGQRFRNHCVAASGETNRNEAISDVGQ